MSTTKIQVYTNTGGSGIKKKVKRYVCDFEEQIHAEAENIAWWAVLAKTMNSTWDKCSRYRLCYSHSSLCWPSCLRGVCTAVYVRILKEQHGKLQCAGSVPKQPTWGGGSHYFSLLLAVEDEYLWGPGSWVGWSSLASGLCEWWEVTFSTAMANTWEQWWQQLGLNTQK